MLKATYDGKFNLAGVEIPCVVLEDGTRLLTSYSFLNVIGLENTGQIFNSSLPPFLQSENLQPFISSSFIKILEPVPFISKEGFNSVGYRAESLPGICFLFVDADDASVLNTQQEQVAQRCREVIAVLVKKGLSALQEETERNKGN